MSSSVPMVPPRSSLEFQTATQLPAPSVVTWGLESDPESVAALLLRGAGAVQEAPLSVERATRMSSSVPMVPPRSSRDSQTATQLPAPSVVTWTSSSNPESVAALVLRGTGAGVTARASPAMMASSNPVAASSPKSASPSRRTSHPFSRPVRV